jgi:hypothetical protein
LDRESLWSEYRELSQKANKKSYVRKKANKNFWDGKKAKKKAKYFS